MNYSLKRFAVKWFYIDFFASIMIQELSWSKEIVNRHITFYYIEDEFRPWPFNFIIVD